MESKRIVWIDVLNILACAGVLLLHSTNKEVHSFSGELSVNWFIGLVTHSMVLWPVNVFFMLSGYTLMKPAILELGGAKRFYKRRLNRLLVPVLTWNTIYMLIQLLSQWHKGGITDSPLTIINKYMSFQYNGFMWFFIPLICLYLTMPFLSIFVLNARRNILKWFILMSIVLNVVGCLGTSQGGRFFDIYLFGTRYLPLAVAGYYFGIYDLSYTTRKKLYMAGWIGAVIIFAGTGWLQLNMPERYNFFLKYINIPCTLTALAVFVYCKYTDWTKVLHSIHINESTLGKLSSLSLGIYLFQYLGFCILGKTNVFKDNMIMTFIVMYVLCVVAILIIKHIPIIRKIV